MSASAAAPVIKSARVQSLDVLRGIALLGILMMNITVFGMLIQAGGNPMVEGGAQGLNMLAYQIIGVGFEGTMRGIFSLLFGAGIVLLTERMENAGAGIMAAEVHFRRMLWMLVFGIIHWTLLLWIGDILFHYAICGLLLFAPRKLPARTQAMIAGLLLVGAALMSTGYQASAIGTHDAAVAAEQVKASGAELTKEQEGAISAWEEFDSYHWPSEEDKAEMRGWHQGSYWNAVTGQLETSFQYQWTSVPERLVFDMIPFMLIGMALLKWNVLSGGLPVRTYALMAAGGYAVGIPLGLYELGIMLDGQFATLAFAEAGLTYQISRLAMVVGHLGAALWVIRLGLFGGLQRGLAAVGQMALSNYLAQTLICTALFYGFGFGLFGKLQRFELYYVVAAVWVVELVWSVLWLRQYRFGPAEWLWRSLTYWQRQPMQRGAEG